MLQNDAETLIDLLETARTSDRGVTFVEGPGDERYVAFADLHRDALRLLGLLQTRGLERGGEVVILTSENRALVTGFWACVFGGMLPVPVPAGAQADTGRRVATVLRKLEHPAVFTSRRDLAALEEHGAVDGWTVICFDDLQDGSAPGTVHAASPDDIAYVQFSSGSTTAPRGVVLTHANLLANIRGIIERAGFDGEVRGLSWMPLTHDMGFIGFHLTPVALAIDHTLMPTDLFVRRPLLWLEEASRRGATVLCSPNFGLAHVLRRFRGQEIPGLDLSRVRLIFNGAEPISATTSRAFVAALEPYGLRSDVMYPVYGLAEASLAVTMPPPGEELVVHRLARSKLGEGDRVAPVGDDSGSGNDGADLVDVGSAVPGCSVRIATEAGEDVADGTVGRILIHGENVTRGYYRDEGATAEALADGGWVRTGDLGFIRAGRLTVTGRAKDIIFVHGANHYPHDLEQAAAEVAGLDLRKLAVVGVREPDAARDRVFVCVQFKGSSESFVPTAKGVRRGLSERTGVAVDHVLPIPRLPRTTSGKLRRHALVERIRAGELDALIAELEDALSEEGAPEPPPPGNPLVEELLAIWSEAFEDIPIGPTDDFFETGADSLALAELADRIETRFPGTVEMSDLTDHRTIAQLAELIASKRS